jgi:hypothetical protein
VRRVSHSERLSSNTVAQPPQPGHAASTRCSPVVAWRLAASSLAIISSAARLARTRPFSPVGTVTAPACGVVDRRDVADRVGGVTGLGFGFWFGVGLEAGDEVGAGTHTREPSGRIASTVRFDAICETGTPISDCGTRGSSASSSAVAGRSVPPGSITAGSTCHGNHWAHSGSVGAHKVPGDHDKFAVDQTVSTPAAFRGREEPTECR